VSEVLGTVIEVSEVLNETLTEKYEVLGGIVIQVPKVFDEILVGLSEVHDGILTDISEAFGMSHCKVPHKLLLHWKASNYLTTSQSRINYPETLIFQI
jgi:hypothetical protein